MVVRAILSAAVLGLAAAAAGAPGSAGERLLLTRPGVSGDSAYYARARDLALDRGAGYAKHYDLDRRNGYGQPSRILNAPLDVGATPFARLGRSAEQNEVDIRVPFVTPEAISRPRRTYDPSRAPGAQDAPPPRSR